MDNQYSRGPWKVVVKGENFYGINSDDGNVCILAAEANARINKLANARLIAMAPELLEALELAARALENVTNESFKMESLAYIRAKIEKANGGHND